RKQLLCKLVNWKSGTLTKGEAEFGKHLADELGQLPYFQEHPEQLMLKDVDRGRSNVLAPYTHPDVTETVILLSHYDTVPTEEYGDLEPLACKPVELTEAMHSVKDELDDAAREDLESGDYLFGRGTMDMKAGLALHMGLIEKASTEEWPINL